MTNQQIVPVIDHTLPAIQFNFNDMKQWAIDVVAHYQGIVITENDVTAIKSEMAALNKVTEQLENKRKEVVKTVSSPIKEFESQIKDVVAIIQSARSDLATQVDYYVQNERKVKESAVRVVIADKKQEFGCDVDIPIQDRWLNKTTTMASVAAEIGNIILKHKKEQEDALALEQAKKDRLAYIELCCQNANAEFGVNISVAHFISLQCLSISADKVAEHIKAEYTRRKEQEAKVAQQQNKVELPRETTQPAQPAQPAQAESQPAPKQEATQPVHKQMTIIATYSSANSKAIEACFYQLKALCETCEVTIKEAQ